MPAEIYKIIRFLEARLESLPDDSSRSFVRDTAARLDKYGDAFYCSWKQHKFLNSLYARLSSAEPEKPKSRLDELQERKAKILKSGKRRRQLARKATKADAANILRVMQDIVTNSLTAKMRHDRSVARQMGADPRSRRGKKANSRNSNGDPDATTEHIGDG